MDKKKISDLSGNEQTKIAQRYVNEVVNSWFDKPMNKENAKAYESESIQWLIKNYNIHDCYFAIIPEDSDYSKIKIEMSILKKPSRNSKILKSDKKIKKDVYLN